MLQKPRAGPALFPQDIPGTETGLAAGGLLGRLGGGQQSSLQELEHRKATLMVFVLGRREN